MSKKMSISFMFIILFCLIIIILGIVKAEPKIKLIDIKGSKVNIGNALFISQKNNGFYCNTQSITSKDEFNFKQNSKSIQNKNNDINVKYQKDEVFKHSYDEALRYYGKNNIGYIRDMGVNEETNRIIIFNKNLKDNSIKTYNLDIPKINDNEYISQLTVDINDDDVYILCNTSNYDSSICNKLGVYIYKYNLNRGESKKVGEFISNKELKDLYRDCFNYNGKLYSFTQTYPLKKGVNIELLLTYYDIKNNKLENIKLSHPMLKSKDFLNLNKYEDPKFSIEGNKVYFLNCINNDEKYIKLIKTTINLNNNKIEDIDTYDVEKLENISYVQSFRVIDKKLYLCIKGYDVENPSDYKPRVYKNSIVVVDEKSKETLYMGEYIEDLPELTDQFILKTDEI